MPRPYSYERYTVTAEQVETPQFSYSGFGLLPADTRPVENQIEVYRNGLKLTLTSQYTINTVSKLVTISVPLTIGDDIQIKRETEKDTLYVDFANNAVLDESDLDLVSNQIFFVAQEAFDLAYDSVHRDSSGVRWDGQSLEAAGFAPATLSSSLVTLGQVQNLVNGAETAYIDQCDVWGFDGDGSETEFSLGTGLSPDLRSCQLLVTIDGALQEPDCEGDDGSEEGNKGYGYIDQNPGGGDPEEKPISTGCGAYELVKDGDIWKIVFATAPDNGASISVRLISGTIAASFAANSVNGDRLANYTVPLTKLVTSPSIGESRRVVRLSESGYASAAYLTPADIVGFFTTGVYTVRISQLLPAATDINLNSHKIVNLIAGSAATDAVNFSQMNSAIDTAKTSAISTANSYTDSVVGTVSALPPNVNNGVVVHGRITSTGSGYETDYAIPSEAKRTGFYSQLVIWYDEENSTALNNWNQSNDAVLLKSWQFSVLDSFPNAVKTLNLRFWDASAGEHVNYPIAEITRTATGFHFKSLITGTQRFHFQLLLNPTN